jgi:sugar phosphate isomerase/epimerase
MGAFEVLAINHPDRSVRTESRDIFRHLLEFTLRVDGGGITILPGVPWEGESREDAFQRAADELAWRVRLAAPLGLRVSIEPHWESIAESVEATLELVRAVPGLSLTLDYTHFVFQGIPEREVDALIPYAQHFHGRQGAPGKMQATSQEGTIDYERIIRRLESDGYRGFFSLEYFWDDWADSKKVDCISETALLRDLFRRVYSG